MPTFGQAFHFNKDKYARHIKSYSNKALSSNEERKIKQTWGQFSSAGLSLGASLLNPLAGAGAVLAARLWLVAFMKLRLIQEELQSRGLALHDTTCWDRCKPVILATIFKCVTLGAFSGLEMELMNLFMPVPSFDAPVTSGGACTVVPDKNAGR